MDIWNKFVDTIVGIMQESGFAGLFTGDGWKNIIMIGVACVLLFLAIKKEFEPLLLLPIAFGMLLTNLPGAGMFHAEFWNQAGGIDYSTVLHEGGLLDLLYMGVKLGIYPPLIFLGIGAMTDFGPLIANPKSFLLGAAAQLGIFVAFIGALALGMPANEAASIGIIGGATAPRPSSSPPNWRLTS